MKKNKQIKHKIKVDYQKLFNTISIGFICACVLFYGARFTSLYIKNKKVEVENVNTLYKVIFNTNFGKENFVDIGGNHYFKNKVDNNYVTYSNILWRIIRINADNSVTLISENPLVSLAYKEEVNFKESYLNKWLNITEEEENTGILEYNLNNPDKYLLKNETCLDVVDKLSNQLCKTTYTDKYLGLMSTSDYVNTGAETSFINNNTKFYLSNTTDTNKIWYITDTNKVSYSDGTDLIGLRPVITVKGNINIVSGNGTLNSPYTFESEKGMFGAYVKLGEDTWRIYQVNEDTINLVSNNLLELNNEAMERIYTNKGYSYNSSKWNTLAYYLNNTYLNSLSYKDKIELNNWANGYYGADNNYNYKEALTDTKDAYVGLLNITNIRLNNELKNYFLMTGSTKNGSLVYLASNNGTIYSTSSDEKNYVLPTITIKKELLTKGEGTIDSPLEME
mgnify:FL=1